MTPWLWIAKIGAVGVFLLLVFGSGYRNGEKAVQGRWDASTLKIAQDQTKLLQEHAQKVADLVEKQRETNLTVSQDHEKALNEIRQKYDADLAAARAGGLRLPRSICPAATGSQTASAGGNHEDAAGTIPLSATITDDLFDFARQADEITEQARECQSWIRKNNFYD